MDSASNGIIKTELHCHLEGAFPPFWLYETARNNGNLSSNVTYTQFYSKMVLKGPTESISQVLAYFDTIGEIITDSETLYEGTVEACRSVHAGGISNLELRFAPILLNRFSGMPFDEILQVIAAAITEVQNSLGMRIGLIAIGERNYPFHKVASVLEWAGSNRDRLIGVDLANTEEGFIPQQYRSLFRDMRVSGLGTTVHAGESAEPEIVRACIEALEPDRIGHGVAIERDEYVLELVRETGTALECCPFSNYITRSVSGPGKHPIRRFLCEGLRATLNTDDPGLFDVNMKGETQFVQEQLGITDEELYKLEGNARCASFFTR